MTRIDSGLIWLAAGALVLSVLAANAHLAYVAFTSQPACIDHASAAFSAAKPAC